MGVATYLGDGPDFGRFASVCKQTREASNYSGGWRSLFTSKFDLPPGGTALLWSVFGQRRTLLSKPIDFCRGNTEDEKTGLRVIRDLVIGKRFHTLKPYGYSHLMGLSLPSEGC